jgi:predicted MPP superfamily phosphohydrolase
MYDIIGDIHGHAALLKKLLKKMGYHKSGEGYMHAERKAVFVGDFTNRGPEIRKTLHIIRQMVDSGNAYAVLGNHEVNNILYQLKNRDNEPLLNLKGKRYLSVSQTIQEFSLYPDEWKDYLRWMRSLPFYLELDGIRIAHAYWSDTNIEILKEHLHGGKTRRKIFRDLVHQPHSLLSKAILQTIRGVHLVLPSDLRILDNRKRSHRFFRVKWWLSPEGMTFHDW